MNFIQQIFTGIQDEEYVHSRFVRFGPGEFRRAFLILKRQSKKVKVWASYDLANDLVDIASSVITRPVHVTGFILASGDFKGELPCEAVEYKKKARLYQAQLDATLTPEQLRQVVSRLKKGYLLLNIKGEEAVLSVGKKLPNPGKELKEDFCTATLPLEALKELAFDFPHPIAEAKIMHRLIIEDIQIPEEYKGDFEKARIMAKRKGRLVRVLDVDGRHEEKEA